MRATIRTILFTRLSQDINFLGEVFLSSLPLSLFYQKDTSIDFLDIGESSHHYHILIIFCAQGQNPDASSDGDFMSEAKDWAGELISGQTGTGRILVRKVF